MPQSDSYLVRTLCPSFPIRNNYIVSNNKKIYITRSSLVVWALHNHPQRILQLSIGRRLPIEAQDAII